MRVPHLVRELRPIGELVMGFKELQERVLCFDVHLKESVWIDCDRCVIVFNVLVLDKLQEHLRAQR